jgi:flagellar biosynthesis protein FlhF
MSNIQVFRAASTQAAYSLVRETFGKDAIILRTHRRKVGWWPWNRTSLIEVEAMSEDEGIAPDAATDAGNAEQTARDQEEWLRHQARVAQLEQLVSQLSVSSSRDADAIPAELFETFTDLLDAGMEQSDARDLIMSVSRDNAAAPRREQARAAILNAIASTLQCHGPICTRQGTRRVVALVGPTGVGKTTTIAKLASNFHLREGVRIGLVTTDTYRSAAVDQLRTYSEALGLPLEVAGNAGELQAALTRLADRELVLIDTAGRSPRDEPRLNELKALLRGSPIDELHLVLSLTTSPRTMTDLSEHFRSLNPSALLLTKLDEAPGPGAIYSAVCRLSFAVSYITTGQGVPDDIELADARRVANRIIRDERTPAT